MRIIRRRAVLTGIGATTIARKAGAQAKSLTLLAHPVIRSVAEATEGGDITAAWRGRTA